MGPGKYNQISGSQRYIICFRKKIPGTLNSWEEREAKGKPSRALKVPCNPPRARFSRQCTSTDFHMLKCFSYSRPKQCESNKPKLGACPETPNFLSFFPPLYLQVPEETVTATYLNAPSWVRENSFSLTSTPIHSSSHFHSVPFFEK